MKSNLSAEDFKELMTYVNEIANLIHKECGERNYYIRVPEGWPSYDEWVLNKKKFHKK
jgi:hypothetical protein